jgi:exportin-2 (importin alpha re-exporter)
LQQQQPQAIQTAAILYFKNLIKATWDLPAGSDPKAIPDQDKQELKASLVIPLLVMSSGNASMIQVQISEAISIMALHDFPAQWPNLIQVVFTRVFDIMCSALYIYMVLMNYTRTCWPI